RPDAAPGAWIVQHEGPIDVAWRDAIGALGARVVGYIPENAYLVRAEGEVAARLRSLPQLRWLGPYRAQDRLSPELVGRLGLADTGVDVSACQFRVAAAGPITLANLTQPPAALATNPSNKIVSYCELSGAQAYDHAGLSFHGTRVAGCAVGDNDATAAART